VLLRLQLDILLLLFLQTLDHGFVQLVSPLLNIWLSAVVVEVGSKILVAVVVLVVSEQELIML